MPIQHHEDHVVLIPRTMPHRTKVALWACVGSAMTFVVLGWVYSMTTTLPRHVSGAGEAFSNAVGTANEMREEVVPRISTQLGSAQDNVAEALSPYVQAVDERQAAVEAAALLTKQKIESQNAPVTEPEPYGEQGTQE